MMSAEKYNPVYCDEWYLQTPYFILYFLDTLVIIIVISIYLEL